MKALISLLLIASAITSRSATIAYWDFDNGNLSNATGNSTYDLTQSGTNHSGSLTNLVDPVPNPDPVAGSTNNGSILSTGGGGGYLIGGSGSTSALRLDGNAWTFEGHLNFNDDGFRPIFSTRALNTGGILFDKRFVGGQNVFNMYLAPSSGSSGSETVFQSVVISKNTDFHFALTHDGSGNFELFVDGVSQATHTSSVNLATADSNSMNSLWLLGRAGDSDGSFGGFADEFRISDSVLTSSQFLNVPEPSTALLGLLGLIPLLRRKRSCNP